MIHTLVVLMAVIVPMGAMAFDEVEDPEAVEPVAFEVVEEDFQLVARKRVVIRIVVEPGTDEEVGAAIAQVIRDGLENNGEAIMAHVFAYNEGDDTNSIYTAGIGYASEDGKGWTGDKALPGGMPQDQEDQEGKIFVVVGGLLDDPDDVAELIFPFDAPEGD